MPNIHKPHTGRGTDEDGRHQPGRGSSQPADVNTSQLSLAPSPKPPHARPPLSEWPDLGLAMGGRVQETGEEVRPGDHSSVLDSVSSALPSPPVINRPEIIIN